MMISKVTSAVIKGIEAVPVTIETDIVRGMPSLTITGLADATVKEAAVRVRAAIVNSGFSFPMGRISINIAPAGIRKKGSVLDLGLAVGILAASGQIPEDGLEKYMLAGEISLDGSVCKTPGVLNITEKAGEAGLFAAVPEANIKEASVIRRAVIYPVGCLKELADHLKGVSCIKKIETGESGMWPQSHGSGALHIPDFADVKGQEPAKRALMIAAAGGHYVLMTGSPSAGKTMLAERMPGIMPELTYEEMIRTTKVYSAAGLLSEGMPYVTERPFRRPHHSITEAALIGGGAYPKPGEMTLASCGILFLDELAEMDPKVIDALREPLESKRIVLLRNGETYVFPADVLLIAASNPCRCGYYGDPDHECTCTPGEIARYRQRISGPVLDRIDIHLQLSGTAYEDLSGSTGLSTDEMREKVAAARETQRKRYEGTGIELNASVPDSMARAVAGIGEKEDAFLREAYMNLGMNPRSLIRTIKIARTIADVDGMEKAGIQELCEAVQYSRWSR